MLAEIEKKIDNLKIKAKKLVHFITQMPTKQKKPKKERMKIMTFDIIVTEISIQQGIKGVISD